MTTAVFPDEEDTLTTEPRVFRCPNIALTSSLRIDTNAGKEFRIHEARHVSLPKVDTLSCCRGSGLGAQVTATIFNYFISDQTVFPVNARQV